MNGLADSVYERSGWRRYSFRKRVVGAVACWVFFVLVGVATLFLIAAPWDLAVTGMYTGISVWWGLMLLGLALDSRVLLRLTVWMIPVLAFALPVTLAWLTSS